jgi:hypothetical protein
MQNTRFERYLLKHLVGKKAAKTKFTKFLIRHSRVNPSEYWELFVGLTGDHFRKHNNLVLENRAQTKRIEMHRKKNEEKRASRMQCFIK